MVSSRSAAVFNFIILCLKSVTDWSKNTSEKSNDILSFIWHMSRAETYLYNITFFFF